MSNYITQAVIADKLGPSILHLHLLVHISYIQCKLTDESTVPFNNNFQL